MYISTETGSFDAYGDIKTIIKMLKDAGFDAYDYSMFYDVKSGQIFMREDYIEQAKELRRFADSIGISCNQAHAPYATYVTCEQYHGMPKDEYNAFAHKSVTRAIEIAGILGARIIVVHPRDDGTVKENATLYQSFEETARKAGVKIAVENMWNWEDGAPTATIAACSHHDDFKAHMDLLNKDVFVACLDIGHAEMRGLNTSAVQMIETLKDDLQALHIHDIDLTYDNHSLPYTKSVDFEKILKALKLINYQGDITLESCCYVQFFPLELYPHVAKLMAAVANYMRKYLQGK